MRGDPQRRLRAALFLAALGLGASFAASAPVASAASATVTIGGFAFSPASVGVEAGGSVAWSNTDGFPHAIVADSGSFETGVVAGGATSAPLAFASPGTYAYHCSIHPGMTGSVVVATPNAPPVLAPVGNRTAVVGQLFSLTLSATDSGPGALAFSATGLPSGATLASSTGALSWTPTGAHVGTHVVTFTVSDGALADSETVTLTVPSVNRAPVAAFTRAVDGLVVTVDASGSSDPDGDALTFAWAWGDGATGATGANRTASHAFAADGSYTIALTASDGALSTTVTLGVSVAAALVANEPPVAAFTVSMRGLVASANASASSDPDGDALAFAWDWGDGSRGSGVSASHAFATPGDYAVRLVVTDALGLSASAERAVTAKRPRIAPVAAFDVEVAGLVARADASGTRDEEGDALTFAWAWGDGATSTGEQASHAYARPGTFEVRLTASDGVNAATVSRNVTVAQANEPPALRVLAGPAPGARVRGVAQWSGTAVDPEGAPVTVTARADDGSSVPVAGSGEWRIAWTPPVGRESTLEIEATDGESTARVAITVFAGDNRPPVVAFGTPAPGARVTGKTPIEGTASDPDGDFVRVEVSIDAGAWTPAGIRPDGSWVFTWDAGVAPAGEHRFAIRASDGLATSKVAEATFVVAAPAPLPPPATPPNGEPGDASAPGARAGEGERNAPFPPALALLALAAAALHARRRR